MTSGRVEVNLCRLLSRCEAMASGSDCQDWRLEKYISTLYEFMAQLRKLNANGPPAEMLNDYARRVDLLRGIAEAKKLSSAVDRSQAVDLLMPSNQVTSSNAGSRDLHAVTKARYQKQMREELLNKDSESSVRQRKTSGMDTDEAVNDDREVDDLIRHHAEMQERIAEEMVHLARNLRENVSASGRIVREDVTKLNKASDLVTANYGKLKVESDRLETHVKRACSSWTLVLLVVVVMTFIWMVLFMKMFPKK